MRSASRRFLSIVLSMVFIAAGLVVYTLLLAPAFEELNSMRGELESKTQLYNDQRQAVERVKALLAQFQENVRLQDTLNSILPVEDPRQSSLLEQINGLAILNSVVLEKIAIQLPALEPAPQKAALAARKGRVRADFSAVGSYESLKNFIAALETNVRLMDLVSFGVEGVGVDQNLFRAAFTVDAYYQPQIKIQR